MGSEGISLVPSSPTYPSYPREEGMRKGISPSKGYRPDFPKFIIIRPKQNP